MIDAEGLLDAARREADPVAAARLLAEAFLALSRTADPAALAPVVTRLAALRPGHRTPRWTSSSTPWPAWCGYGPGASTPSGTSTSRCASSPSTDWPATRCTWSAP
ncbi:hypothetical protein [Phytohabitans flavus]|uniref:hypothetical protein n=1 Tax=Phytohabitans flavus TaxID=1076124 RepID=UPI0015641448|nr:hypothetical protein [Phytohabitans flavus]